MGARRLAASPAGSTFGWRGFGLGEEAAAWLKLEEWVGEGLVAPGRTTVKGRPSRDLLGSWRILTRSMEGELRHSS